MKKKPLDHYYLIMELRTRAQDGYYADLIFARPAFESWRSQFPKGIWLLADVVEYDLKWIPEALWASTLLTDLEEKAVALGLPKEDAVLVPELLLREQHAK